jgi:ribosomal protein S12 methylthiotransferase
MLDSAAPAPAPGGPAEAPRSVVGRPGYNYDAYSPRLLTTPVWSTYVKIAEGCSQVCSLLHHPEAARRPEEPPDRRHRHRGAGAGGGGALELNLIAQDLTHYGDDRKTPPASRRCCASS